MKKLHGKAMLIFILLIALTVVVGILAFRDMWAGAWTGEAHSPFEFLLKILLLPIYLNREIGITPLIVLPL